MLSGRRARRKHSGHVRSMRVRLGLGAGEEMGGHVGYRMKD